MRSIHRDLLRGQENSRSEINLARSGRRNPRSRNRRGQSRAQDPRWAKIDNREKPLPVFTVLPSGYGYVDLARLTVAEVDKMFETIKRAPAVIFDMRGYPQRHGLGDCAAPDGKEKRRRRNVFAPDLDGEKFGRFGFYGRNEFHFRAKTARTQRRRL